MLPVASLASREMERISEARTREFQELIGKVRRQNRLDEEWADALLEKSYEPLSTVPPGQHMAVMGAFAILLLLIIAVMAIPYPLTSGRVTPQRAESGIAEDSVLGDTAEALNQRRIEPGLRNVDALEDSRTRLDLATISVDVKGTAPGQKAKNLKPGEPTATFNLTTHSVSVSIGVGEDGEEAIVDVPVASVLTRVFVDVSVNSQPKLPEPRVVFEGGSMVIRWLNHNSDEFDSLVLIMGERRRDVERAVIVPQRNCEVSIAVSEGTLLASTDSAAISAFLSFPEAGHRHQI